MNQKNKSNRQGGLQRSFIPTGEASFVVNYSAVVVSHNVWRDYSAPVSPYLIGTLAPSVCPTQDMCCMVGNTIILNKLALKNY